MKSCNGMGLCGCGSAHCAVVEWWRVFAVQWRWIAYEMVEIQNEMIDNAIDFEREQEL